MSLTLIQRRTTSVFLIIGAMLLAQATLTPSADAATAVLKPCTSTAVDYRSQWYTSLPSTDPAWVLEAGCPSLTLFRAAPYKPGNPKTGTYFYPQSGLIKGQVTAVEFGLSGSDGSESSILNSVYVCSGSTCGTRIAPGGSNVNTPELHRVEYPSGHVPAGANHVRVSGQCQLADGCAPSRALELRNLAIEFTDNGIPTAEFKNPIVLGDTIPLALGQWNNGWRTLYFVGKDTVSGVKYADIVVGPAHRRIENIGCGAAIQPAISKLCPSSYQFSWLLDMWGTLSMIGLVQGENPVTVTVVDGAGNQSVTLNSSFKADNVPPSMTDLRVTTAGPQGWQEDKKIDLEWRNLGETVETSTSSGLESAVYDLDPLDPGMPDPAAVQVPITSLDSISAIDVPSNGRWRLSLMLFDRAGNFGYPRDATFGIDDTVPDAPEIEDPGLIGKPQLEEDTPVRWAPPANEHLIPSKVCGYAYAVDQSSLTDPGRYPNVEAEVLEQALPSTMATGDYWIHVRAVTCSGAVSEIARRKIEVDATPPALTRSQPGSNGWYSDATPLVIGATDANAPVSLRVSAGFAVGDWVDGPSVEVQLEEGETNVTVEARDSAGNISTERFATRFDSSAPTISLKRPSASQPTLLTATLSDAVSGVSAGSLSLRREGGSWQSLATIPTAASNGRDLQLLARIPDFELPTGRYELMTESVDRAGNKTVSRVFSDGSPASFSLPLRSRSDVVVGFRPFVLARSCKGKGQRRKCKSKRVKSKSERIDTVFVAHRRSDRVDGVLLDSAGVPLGGRNLDVVESIVGRPPSQVGTVTTAADGRFSYLPPAGPSRRLAFRFGGDERVMPSDSTVRFLVRPHISFVVSKRTVRPGRPIVFSGRITADGAEFPRSGMRVDIEFRSGTRWIPFPIEVTADRTGRFRVAYAFSTKRALRYRLRARVRWVEGWVYETGYSRTVGLTVR